MSNRVWFFLKKTSRRLARFRQQNAVPPNPCHDDIYLVEYPKSGITYLSFLLGNVELELAQRQEKMTFYNHHRYVVDVHQLRGASVDRQLNRTFIKSHSSFNYSYYFVVYLIRNPLDVMVSYYNFMLDQGYTGNFEFFVKDRRYGIDRWRAHLDSWWYKQVDAQRIHFVRYEDLLQDAAGQLGVLYQNIGLDVPPEILAESIERASVKNMRASEEHYRSFNPNYTMAFVGRKDKVQKSDVMSPNIKKYILRSASDAIRAFYPNLAE